MPDLSRDLTRDWPYVIVDSGALRTADMRRPTYPGYLYDIEHGHLWLGAYCRIATQEEKAAGGTYRKVVLDHPEDLDLWNEWCADYVPRDTPEHTLQAILTDLERAYADNQRREWDRRGYRFRNVHPSNQDSFRAANSGIPFATPEQIAAMIADVHEQACADVDVTSIVLRHLPHLREAAYR